MKKEVEKTIVKKARKWFSCSDGSRLFIDENTKNFEVGETYNFMATEEDKRDQKYGELNYYFIAFEVDHSLINLEVQSAKNEAIENYLDFCDLPKVTAQKNGNNGFRYREDRKELLKLKLEISKFELTLDEKNVISEAEKKLEVNIKARIEQKTKALDESIKRQIENEEARKAEWMRSKMQMAASFYSDFEAGIDSHFNCWECGSKTYYTYITSDGTCGNC